MKHKRSELSDTSATLFGKLSTREFIRYSWVAVKRAKPIFPIYLISLLVYAALRGWPFSEGVGGIFLVGPIIIGVALLPAGSRLKRQFVVARKLEGTIQESGSRDLVRSTTQEPAPRTGSAWQRFFLPRKTLKWWQLYLCIAFVASSLATSIGGDTLFERVCFGILAAIGILLLTRDVRQRRRGRNLLAAPLLPQGMEGDGRSE